MHGIIFSELKKFVSDKTGDSVWNQLLEAAGMQGQSYSLADVFPDAEMVALVEAAAEKMGLSAEDVLEEFGRFIAPDLVHLYGALVNPAWKTLDLLEHAEKTIHTVVRTRDKLARPPELICSRSGANEVRITYSSHRKLCAVARGIVMGVAAHYGEKVQITESHCMLRGDDRCEIFVRI